MCGSSPPPPPPPPAPAVPLPAEVIRTPQVETSSATEANSKLKRSGRSRLTVPAAGAASTTGMSGLNIPQ